MGFFLEAFLAVDFLTPAVFKAFFLASFIGLTPFFREAKGIRSWSEFFDQD